jgi:thioredoxin
MNKVLYLILLGVFLTLVSCDQTPDKQVKKATGNNNETQLGTVTHESGKPEYLTVETFKQKVWNYDVNPDEWIYNGEVPSIVDFYADWCKPCRIIAPIMEELAAHYEGRLKVYKVDTEAQRELAAVFQIRSIPTILFAPMNGRPAMQPGAMSKEEYMRIIEEFVLKTTSQHTNQINTNKES